MSVNLSPYRAHRWVNCMGSVQAEQQYSNKSGQPAKDGGAAHEIGAELVMRVGAGETWQWSDFEGKTATNGVMFTQEMFEAAEIYAQDVRRRHALGDTVQLVEDRITIQRVHDLNQGIVDCMVWNNSYNILTVWDFKFGRSMVEAHRNWQLIDYAVGLHEKLGNDETQIELRIVQPRAFHPEGPCRGWTITAEELNSYANTLANAAELSQQEHPPCVAGDWCKGYWSCAAAKDCTTLQRAGAEIADRVETLDLCELSPENTAIELQYLTQAKLLVDERLEALEAQGLAQIANGTAIPGFGIGYGRGSFAWNKSNKEVILMGDLMGVNLRKSEEPMTPTQAKKLKLDEAVINQYADRTKGKARLVPARETIASRVFSSQ